MKISVVTAVYNRHVTIGDAIESVAAQSHPNLEHITVDAMSDDGSSEIIEQHSGSISRRIREPDKGIYDALNKGIQAATGEVVGFLHADDLFAHVDVIAWISDLMNSEDFDAVYGDLTYVGFQDPKKVIRYWQSGKYDRSRFRRGWMPPHPTVYVRREIYEKHGGYRTDLGSAADYECMVRLLYKNQIRVGYIPKIFVKMRVGGESNASLRNRLIANRNDQKAWIENGIKPPFGLRLSKPISKIKSYFMRPERDSSK